MSEVLNAFKKAFETLAAKLRENSKDILLVTVIAGAALGSYFYFQTYTPKSLKQLREISSYESNNSTFKLPQMKGTKEIGSSSTDNGRQVTLEISRTPEEIRSFYKNVFLDRGWKVLEQTESSEFLTDLYKKDDQKAKLTISKDTSKPTVVGINFNEE